MWFMRHKQQTTQTFFASQTIISLSSIACKPFHSHSPLNRKLINKKKKHVLLQFIALFDDRVTFILIFLTFCIATITFLKVKNGGGGSQGRQDRVHRMLAQDNPITLHHAPCFICWHWWSSLWLWHRLVTTMSTILVKCGWFGLNYETVSKTLMSRPISSLSLTP